MMQKNNLDNADKFIICIFFNFITQHTEEIKNFYKKYLLKKNIKNFSINRYLMKKILYNIRTFRNSINEYPTLFESKNSKHQLRYDIFSESKTTFSLQVNNIHKNIMMQNKKEHVFFNFFNENEHTRYIKIIKLVCYFLTTCVHCILHSSSKHNMMYKLRFSSKFVDIMDLYMVEFLKTIRIKDLLIIFTNLIPYITSKILSIQIHLWSILVFQEVQKKKYSLKILLGYNITGMKLLMQSLIEHSDFLHIIYKTILRNNMKLTYSVLKNIAENILYPKKNHPTNIMYLSYQFTSMVHKTIHLYKNTRKAPGGSGKSSYKKYSKHMYHITLKYYIPFITIMLLDTMISKFIHSFIRIDSIVKFNYKKIQ
uniref:Uncharacterized protein n=1 Tax=Lotharella vacuolata TaxID=74820 RepID=A0A0H5BHN9_9EUKA|nr:hypothetical protein [Lotharella vacuolata]BAS01692.1 hypothetical protein [Lotharella vacuolata]